MRKKLPKSQLGSCEVEFEVVTDGHQVKHIVVTRLKVRRHNDSQEGHLSTKRV